MKIELVFNDGRKEIFDSVESFNVIGKQTVSQPKTALKGVESLTGGKLFLVTPLEINRSCFEEPLRDNRMEKVREWILDAFKELDKNPERYASPFYTLIPKKTWKGPKPLIELAEYASDLGGNIADWVEQSLEWAWRISNGESWENLCIKADTAEDHRVIICNRWKHHDKRVSSFLIVGSSRYWGMPATYTARLYYDSRSGAPSDYGVPLVVFKK